MKHPKHPKHRLSVRMSHRFRMIGRPPVWIGGVSFTVVALAVRLYVGSPWYVLRHLGVGQCLSPLWLIGLIRLCLFFLVGACCGFLMAQCTDQPIREAAVYRGCMYMILSVTASLWWYFLLFGPLYLWLSLLCQLVTVGTGILAVLAWWHLFRPASWIAVSFSCFHVWILLVQTFFLFHA